MDAPLTERDLMETATNQGFVIKGEWGSQVQQPKYILELISTTFDIVVVDKAVLVCTFGCVH